MVCSPISLLLKIGKRKCAEVKCLSNVKQWERQCSYSGSFLNLPKPSLHACFAAGDRLPSPSTSFNILSLLQGKRSQVTLSQRIVKQILSIFWTPMVSYLCLACKFMILFSTWLFKKMSSCLVDCEHLQVSVLPTRAPAVLCSIMDARPIFIKWLDEPLVTRHTVDTYLESFVSCCRPVLFKVWPPD